MPKSKNHRKRFNKKQSVRFALIPGPQKDGKPSTIFRPLQSHKSRLTNRQRQNIIKELTNDQFDQIQINGRDVQSSQIPAFVLQQIKGRKDLVFNQKNMMNNQEQEQMLEEEQDLIDQADYQDQYNQEQGNMQLDGEVNQDEQDIQYDQNQIMQQDQWESDKEEGNQEIIEVNDQQQNVNKISAKDKKFDLNEQDFPSMQQTVEVQFQGKKYTLTKKQEQLLNCVLPQNYHEVLIPGVKFSKYNEDGLNLKYKDKFQQFIADQNRVVVDTYQFISQQPLDMVDNDLKPSQIKGQFKEIQDALDFQGQDDAYQELQDDFFAKLISGNVEQELQQKKQSKDKKKKIKKQKKKLSKNVEFQADSIKFQEKAKNIIMKQPQITDQMLDKALQQFQNQHNLHQFDYESNSANDKPINNQLMTIFDLQKLQEYLGKDGQLDWRKLSKPAKKQYMRQKKIRQFYDQARQRQIQQKMKDKKNINPQDLHLKQWVAKINFEQDHVQKALLNKGDDEKGIQDDSSEYQTTSQDDDITSYRMKTSIIASNLSIIEQPSKKKKKEKKNDQQQGQWQDDQKSQQNSVLNQQKPKYVPQKRDRNQTKQQRKARKQRVKQMKKNAKQYKKQFKQQFGNEKKKFTKGQNKSQFHKISCIKYN